MRKIFFASFLLLLASFGFAQPSMTADEYTFLFFTKFNETQTRLTYMNKKSSLAKVGTETIYGKVSGSVFYDVKIKGAGADVTLRYDNYCDEEGWTFDGEIITHSNMAQNGSFEGSIKISGNAPGQVSYDKVKLVKGNPGAGVYLVTLPGKEAAEVDYKVYLESKN